jgi:cytochrome c biogenesis protein CcdA
LLYLLSGRVRKTQWHWFDGVVAGILTTVGATIIFAAASLLLSTLGHVLFEMVPIISLFMAVFLVILAVFTWRGSLNFGTIPGTGMISNLQKTFERGSPQAFIAYGLSFGMVSLTCSLPVFMVVVGEGLNRPLSAETALYSAFALGLGTIIIGLSTITAVARVFVERLIYQVMPMVQKASAVIMIAAAVYLAWYWLVGPGLSTVFS